MENLKLRKEIGQFEKMNTSNQNNYCGKKYELCPTNDITMPNI